MGAIIFSYLKFMKQISHWALFLLQGKHHRLAGSKFLQEICVVIPPFSYPYFKVKYLSKASHQNNSSREKAQADSAECHSKADP